MLKLAISTVGDELEAAAELCRSEGVGLEVQDFAYPENLDNDPSKRIHRHTEAVKNIAPLIVHGPCFDLMASSIDPAVVAVTKNRHDTALAAARTIGAKWYVAHTNYNPLIRNASFRKNWTGRMLNFWLPIADEAGKAGIVICLENLWEPTPDIQAELVTTGNHPHLKASFDNGHALVFSSESSSRWVETLGSMMAHCHLHDNSGELDEHKPVGEGKENWPELVKALRDHAPQAVVVAESESLVDNKLSLQRLRTY